MSEYLFAYGFLKRAYHGNQKTNTPPMDVDFISEGLYTGRIYQVAAYPGVVYDETAGYHVMGEVFMMRNPGKILPVLDAYERALPSVKSNPEYQRILRTIKTPAGFLECWVYEYLRPVNEEQRIPGGYF